MSTADSSVGRVDKNRPGFRLAQRWESGHVAGGVPGLGCRPDCGGVLSPTTCYAAPICSESGTEACETRTWSSLS